MIVSQICLVPLLLLFMAAACDLVSTMNPLEAPPRVSFINFSSSRLLLLPIAVNGWPHRNSTTCVLIIITLKRNFSRPKFTVAHICHGKTYFPMAKLTFPRQNLLFHGKTYFSTAKLTFPRQNLLFHGKTYFPTAKLTFPRQNLLFHGKTLLFHGKTS